MGVKGLWQLLLPIGVRIDVETLEGQILAVDASIWLTQFVKAMKDPDTGSVRPAAHIIGFFRRICKLRFHGIRPVFIFDGPTPEIKRRELIARRRRRDQFVAQHGEAAVQRMAKRLLMEQLKRAQAKIVVNEKREVAIHMNNNGNDNNDDNVEEDDEGGAFAPGFSLPEREIAKNDNSGSSEDAANFRIQNGELLITDGNSSHKQTQSTEILNDNDWDKPIDVDGDEDDEDYDDEAEEKNGESSNEDEAVEYDDVLWSSGRSRRRKKHRSKKRKSKDGFFDEDYILSLDPTDRKGAIEEAKKKQRMLSRREFLPVAANAAEYSSTQVRNFLRSSKLNKDIVKMAKKAVHRDSKDQGEVMASDRTRRIIFEKDADSPSKKKKRSKGFPFKFNDDSESSSSSSDDSSGRDDDEDEEGGESDDGGFLRTDERPTNARRLRSRQQTGQSAQQSTGENEDGGIRPHFHRLRKVGFQGHSQNEEMGSDDDADGGFFAASDGNSNKQKAIVDADDDDDSETGGGFMKSVTVSKPSGERTNAQTVGTGISSLQTDGEEPLHRKQTQDTQSRQVRFQDDDNEDTAGGEWDDDAAKPASRRVPKGARRLPVSAKAAVTMAGPLFRVDDDDSSEEGGGFLRGKPVESYAKLKTTGLDDEVVVIDDEPSKVAGKPSNSAHSVDDDDIAAQELQDQMLAKALQEEEDANYAASYAESKVITIDDDNKPDHEFESSRNLESHKLDSDNELKRLKAKTSAPMPMKPPIVMPTMMADEADESGDDDDVDWEDTDPVEGDIGSEAIDAEESCTPNSQSVPGKTVLAGSTNHARESEAVDQAAGDNGRENDEVEWEDGDNGDDDNRPKQQGEEKVETPRQQSASMEDGGLPRQQSASTEDSDFPRQQSASTEDGDFPRQQSGSTAENEEEDDDPFMDVDIQGDGDFGGRVEVDNDTALKQAEATAANLTNWAGRAMRRAIADHKAAQREPEHLNQQVKTRQQTKQDESPLRPESEEANNAVDIVSGSENVLDINADNAEETAEPIQEYETEIADASIERDSEAPTDEMQEEIKCLLQLFGVPWVQAPAEAEAQCVELEKLGLVNGVVTEDSDAFVFGAKKIYKNIFDDQKYVEIYKASDAERELGIGRNGMIALAMLLGGDYTEGVKGVGIVNGMEVIRDFNVAEDLKGGLQRFRAWLDGFEPVVEANAKKEKGKVLSKEQRFHYEHRTGRNKWIAPESFPSDAVISAYTNPVVDNSTTKFSFGVPDMDGILKFLTKHAGWVPEETRRVLAPVVERVEGKRSYQPRIDSYMTYERGIKFADVRSKRLRKVFESVRNGGNEESDLVCDISERALPKAKRPRRRSRLNKALERQGSKVGTSLPTESAVGLVHVNLEAADAPAVTADSFTEYDNSIDQIVQAGQAARVNAKAQPKKAPTKLSTYLGQAKSSEEKRTERERAEAVLEQQKKKLPSRPPHAYAATSKLAARAPPAYSATSNLASDANDGTEGSADDPSERPNFPSMSLD
ncbi:XP-G cells homolog [Seminavis robusta]|uniref:XP-G cells homolog n=1 Tax=Seminavis robusta TaxID=568900 RepID=A0A9N8DGM2_9STRA|nr:XP-G cells homolog [Seminavis robusta]|eukprot:Sro135_g063710.1 XP-G cells homolog (1506) ;mRNA; r:27767-32375